MWKVKTTPAYRALARQGGFRKDSQDALASRLSTNPHSGDLLENFHGFDIRQLRWSKFMVVFEVYQASKTIKLTALMPWSPDLSKGINISRLIRKIAGLLGAAKFVDEALELMEKFGDRFDLPEDSGDGDNLMHAQEIPVGDWPHLRAMDRWTSDDTESIQSQFIVGWFGFGKTHALLNVLKDVSRAQPQAEQDKAKGAQGRFTEVDRAAWAGIEASNELLAKLRTSLLSYHLRYQENEGGSSGAGMNFSGEHCSSRSFVDSTRNVKASLGEGLGRPQFLHWLRDAENRMSASSKRSSTRQRLSRPGKSFRSDLIDSGDSTAVLRCAYGPNSAGRHMTRAATARYATDSLDERNQSTLIGRKPHGAVIGDADHYIETSFFSRKLVAYCGYSTRQARQSELTALASSLRCKLSSSTSNWPTSRMGIQPDRGQLKKSSRWAS